ncbi:MAG: hypothetical protein JW934_00880 [Anaerolineae bacterium]|nr:hypothetical protein [Anaerolineae bacterium]
MDECVDPLELEEGALQAFIDGEENVQVQTHLERCSYCAAQVKERRRVAAKLKAIFYRHDCPAPEQLGLYQLGLLSASERLIVSKHIRKCAHCAQELIVLAQDEERPSLLEKLQQAVDVIEAVLVPACRPELASLRGTSPAMQRFYIQDAALAHPLDVFVNVKPGYSRGYRTVMGRVSTEAQKDLPNTACAVWLMRQQEAWASVLDKRNAFAFYDVEPGEYDIGLEWHGKALLIKQVTVQ